jgi:hypothetical protein
MSIVIEHPWLAAVIASGFWILWQMRRHRLTAVAASLWTVYLVYESLMRWRILCTGECNIRVDLLLIYPVLGVMSVVAVIYGLRPPGEPG